MSEEAKARGTTAVVNTRCPNCKELVSVVFRAFLEGVGEFDAEASNTTYRDTLIEPKRLILEEAERNGSLQAFTDAVTRIQTNVKPKNMERFFLNWMATCQPAVLPKDQLNALVSEFRGRVEIYQWVSIAAVIVDGYLRTFIPYTGKEPKFKPQPFQQSAILEGWLRSRYGYIPGKGAFFEAMRSNRTAADFARLVQ